MRSLSKWSRLSVNYFVFVASLFRHALNRWTAHRYRNRSPPNNCTCRNVWPHCFEWLASIWCPATLLLQVWKIHDWRSYWFLAHWNSMKCVAPLAPMWRNIRCGVYRRPHRIAAVWMWCAVPVSWIRRRRLWFRENRPQSLCRNTDRPFRSIRWFSVYFSCRERVADSSTSGEWREKIYHQIGFASNVRMARMRGTKEQALTRSTGSWTQTISSGFPSARQFSVTLLPRSASTVCGTSTNTGASEKRDWMNRLNGNEKRKSHMHKII